MFKFELTDKPPAGKFYILAKFEGGDGDTDHPQKYPIPGVTANNWEDNIGLIESELRLFEALQGVLDARFCESYDEVLEEYGERVAELFDEVPNDPQGDYQFKCYLSNVELIYHNSEGKWRSYVNLSDYEV